jgi:hypothetical protein
MNFLSSLVVLAILAAFGFYILLPVAVNMIEFMFTPIAVAVYLFLVVKAVMYAAKTFNAFANSIDTEF